MSRFLCFFIIIINVQVCYARECKIQHTEWSNLCIILEKRSTQKQQKMKLLEHTIYDFENFLLTTDENLNNLSELQTTLPKTTLELLMSIAFRNVSVKDAEAIAKYLKSMLLSYNFQNINAFDENTSHIIGRDWPEIDYSNEGMTWQKQKTKYEKYGISNFKTIQNIEQFFPVESKLPYFKKIYKPRNAYY